MGTNLELKIPINNVFSKLNFKLKNYFYFLISRVIVTVSPMLTGLIAARYLGPEGRGQIAISIAVTVFSIGIFSFGFSSYLRFVGSGKIITGLDGLVYKFLLLAFFSLVFAFIFFTFLTKNKNYLDWGASFLTSLIAFSGVLQNIIHNYILGKKNYKKYFLLESFSPLFCLFIFTFFRLLGEASVNLYLISLAIPSLAVALYGLVVFGKDQKKSYFNSFQVKVLKNFWIYELIQLIMLKSDRLIVGILFTLYDAGQFAVASALTSFSRIIPESLGNLLSQSALLEKLRENKIKIILRVLIINLFNIILLFIIYLNLNQLIIFLFGFGFENAIGIAKILILYEITLVALLSISKYLLGIKNEKFFNNVFFIGMVIYLAVIIFINEILTIDTFIYSIIVFYSILIIIFTLKLARQKDKYVS